MIGLSCVLFMFGLINSFFQSRSPVRKALSQVLPREILASLPEGLPESELIVAAASEMQLESQEILELVADSLGMKPLVRVPIPEQRAVELSGHSQESLMAHSVVPILSYSSPSGFSLAVSDPEQIDFGKYKARGLSVYLSTGSEIEKAWRLFGSGSIEGSVQENLVAGVQKLLDKVDEDGGDNLLLSYPTNDSYQYEIDGKVFRGKISVKALEGLFELLETDSCGESFQGKYLKISSFKGKRVIQVFEKSLKSKLEVSQTPSEELLQKNTESIAFQDPKLEFGEILLVDDDDRLRGLLASILKSKGFICRTASDGEEALEILKSNNESLGLVVSDMHMPKVDGMTLLRKSKRAWPSVPFLILSNDEDADLEAEFVLEGAGAFVRKTQDPCVLVAWCRRLLGEVSKPSLEDSSFSDESELSI